MSQNSKNVDRVLLNAVTTGSAAFTPRAGAATQAGLYHHISWATGVTAGAVTIEIADSSTYAGTWATVAVVTYSSGAPAQDYVYTPGQPKAIRHRVSTTISGGSAPSVTTRIFGA
jgi:hypothetical protein